MKQFANYIISNTKSIKDALEALNKMEGKDRPTLFVVNDQNAMVGTLTDGDVRRGLLGGKNLNDSLQEIMFRNYRFLQRNKFTLADIDKLRKEEIELIPLLDDHKKIIRILDLQDKRSILPVDALIMAGGEGKRLLPLTKDTPKPLLKVGSKPIIEHNVDRLDAYGIDNIWISINYLGHQLESYFSDGSSRGIKINYVKEKDQLGTLGSVTLVDDFIHDTVLVMNSDLLTTIDLEDFYRCFKEEKADMAVASVPYTVNVPYAIMEVEGSQVRSLKEKPTYTYYSNAGIYLIKKSILDKLPKNKFLNATDLMEQLISDKNKLVYYPILGYWLDIGQHEDYKKAQEDIKHLKL